jgi:hypothetical protein
MVTLIAEHVNAVSQFYDWVPGMEFDGMCSTIPAEPPLSPKKQAKRQFATMLATICAGDLGLDPAEDEPIFLSRDTEIFCAGLASQTIGELIDEVDDLLIALEPLPESDPDIRSAYGTVANCLDDINNGIGIGETCDRELDIVRVPGQEVDPFKIGAGEDPDGGSDLPPDPNVIGRSSDATTVSPSAASLWSLYPNPVRQGQSAVLNYVVPDGGADVHIAVYNVAGRRVAELVNGFEPEGNGTVEWNVGSRDGLRLSHGIYFVRAAVGLEVRVSRVLLID